MAAGESLELSMNRERSSDLSCQVSADIRVQLQRDFKAAKEMEALPGVSWDRKNHRLSASQDAWDAAEKVSRGAMILNCEIDSSSSRPTPTSTRRSICPATTRSPSFAYPTTPAVAFEENLERLWRPSATAPACCRSPSAVDTGRGRSQAWATRAVLLTCRTDTWRCRK
jgi:hypothetical protein